MAKVSTKVAFILFLATFISCEKNEIKTKTESSEQVTNGPSTPYEAISDAEIQRIEPSSNFSNIFFP